MERWGHSSHLLADGRVIVFGGFAKGKMNGHGRRNDLIILQPKLRTREFVEVKEDEDIPRGRERHASVMLGDDRYMLVIGGRTNPKTALDDVWIWDTEESRWFRVKIEGEICPGRWRHTLSAIGSHSVIMVGGKNANEVLGDVWNLELQDDYQTGVWTRLPDISPRHSHACVVINQEIYIHGGLDDTMEMDEAIYILCENEWKVVGYLEWRYSHQLIALDGHTIAMIGGSTRSIADPIVCLNLESGAEIRPELVSCEDHHHRHRRVLWLKHQIVKLENNRLLLVAGGAFCFSFGSRFNDIGEIHIESPENWRICHSQWS